MLEWELRAAMMRHKREAEGEELLGWHRLLKSSKAPPPPPQHISSNKAMVPKPSETKHSNTQPYVGHSRSNHQILELF